MTKPQTDSPNPTISVSLDCLALSELNPRQDVKPDDIQSLADSIRTVGLLQNLSGFRTGQNKIEIVAGGRRLRALELIADQDGTAPCDVAVPVMVTDDKSVAQGWASTENVVRKSLHPADEIRAFAEMTKTGMSIPEIAKAFGTTVKHVTGRMKLACLPAPIIAALRQDQITLDTAAAYTVANDELHALAVFEDVQGTWMEHRPNEIRNRLFPDEDQTARRLAQFVGRARYEAGGGEVREDLFGKEVIFLDKDLLSKLATEKLEREGAILRESGWSWVEAGFDRMPWDVSDKYGRTYPEPVDLSEEDAKRYEELTNRVDEEDLSDKELAKLDALEAKLRQEVYTADQMAHSGAYLFIGFQGQIEIAAGLVKPEQREAAQEAGVCRASHHGNRPTNDDTPKRAYSGKLTSDLGEIRTAAIQTALLSRPELALDLLTFVLSENVGWSGKPLGISTDPAKNNPEADEGLVLDDRLKGSDDGWPIDGEKAAEAFHAFRARSKKERNAALTAAVARLFSARLTDDAPSPVAEAVAEAAGVRVRTVWTPTQSFLKRLKGAQLDAIMTEIMGDGLPDSFAKMKKTEKVARLAMIFSNEKGIPPLNAGQRSRADAWLPEGMMKAEQAAKSEEEQAA